MKLHKKALSLVFSNKEGKALCVKRSSSKDSFPNFWSLPSAWIKDNETFAQVAKNLSKKKLGLENIEIEQKPLGVSEVDRGDFILEMSDYNVINFQGEIKLNSEEYVDMKWVTPEELKNIFDKEHDGMVGDCCKTFLRTKGLLK